MAPQVANALQSKCIQAPQQEDVKIALERVEDICFSERSQSFSRCS